MDSARSRLKFTAITILAVVSVSSGVSLFAGDARELAYDFRGMRGVCLEDRCIDLYSITVGNTGGETVEALELTMQPLPAEQIVLPIKASNFGVVPRALETYERDALLHVVIGALEPGKRVELKWSLYAPPDTAPLGEGDLQPRIHAAQTTIVKGSPEMITFGRFLAHLPW